jgi:LCP family protein required for cell wall assembly
MDRLQEGSPITTVSTPPSESVLPAERRSRTRRILGRIALGLAVVLVVTLAGGVLVYKHLAGNITHQAIDRINGAPPKLNKAQNILLIGSDTRAFAGGAAFGRDVGGARSDTTILVHLSAGGRKAVLVSIPRDSYVEIPKCRLSNGQISTPHMDKFNSAYALGGPSCTIATVESLTDIRIDHFVEVNFQGFQRMVNALGGVNICLSKDINDPVRLSGGHYIGSGLVLPAGPHTLKGKEALAFVRARYGVGDGSDIGRIKDQQLFISSVIRKATSAGLLFNPIALYNFLDAATKSIRTDPHFGLSQMKSLADRLHGLKPGTVTLLTVPFLFNAPGVPAADVGWDPAKAPALWRALRDDTGLPGEARPTPAPSSSAVSTLTVPPSAIHVRVLNGTGASGIAHRVAAQLASEGFIVSSGNAGASNYATSVVRYGSSREQSSQTVAAAVPGSVRQPDPSLGSSVELIIGANFSNVVPVTVAQVTPAPSPSSSLDSITADQNLCAS